MIHYRQERLLEKHFQTENLVSDSYTYQGNKVEITPENFESLDPRIKQSYSTYLAKKYPSPKKPVLTQGPGEDPKSKTDESDEKGKSWVDERNSHRSPKENFIRQQLIRLATVERIVEDKLHYPRVFQRLLSQPHLAFEEKKKVYDTKMNLHVFVDKCTGYNWKDKGFMNSLYNVGSTIKGITMYDCPGLRPEGHKYYTEIVKTLPIDSRIIVFSQGCGGVQARLDYPHTVRYVTHFCKGDDCGCDTIQTHQEMASEGGKITFNYGIVNELDLHKVVL